MRCRRLLTLEMAFLLGLAVACGGSGTPPAGRLDADLGEADGGQARSRSRQRASKTVMPQEIPLLSLEGLLPEPEAPSANVEDGQNEGEGTEGGALPKASQSNAHRDGPAAAPPAAATSPQAEVQAALPPRNLFAFEEDPAVVAERQKQALAAAEVARKAEELRRKWQGPPPPPPPPQPPAIPFQFVGYFGAPADRTGVFTGAGEPGPKLAKKGDTLMTQFKIVEIGYESAEIGFKNFTETRRIPLSSGGK